MTDNPNVPQRVKGVQGAVSIATSGREVCALLRNSTLSCWGQVSRVGNSRWNIDSNVPMVVDVGHPIVSISMAYSENCAISSDGSTYCWGNERNRLGGGPEPQPYVYRPEPISPSVDSPIVAISLGLSGNCALLQDTTVACWGNFDLAGSGRRSGHPGTSTPLRVLLTGVFGVINAFVYVDRTWSSQTGAPGLGYLSVQGEIVVQVAFDSESISEFLTPTGTVDVFNGATRICASVPFVKRDLRFEWRGAAEPLPPTYYFAKCVVAAGTWGVGKVQLTAKFSGGAQFTSTTTQVEAFAIDNGEMRFRRIVEFRQTALDYYFMTSRANEIALLDGMSAQGWQRTGQSFRVASEQSAVGRDFGRPLRRFYFDRIARNATRGSYFYTSSASDVDVLRALNPQNTQAPRLPYDEGVDSMVFAPPQGSTCAYNGFQVSVYRFFRTASDDPNHRYVADLGLAASMPRSVWQYEGIAFCALQ